jgi:hypothetical protein
VKVAAALWTVVALGCLLVSPLLAQNAQRPGELDSSTVVRLHWPEGREKGRLLAPLRWDSDVVRYCRYPSFICGEATSNPPRVRAVSDLARLEVRRGNRMKQGALIGAGIGTLGGLAILVGQGLSDAPAQRTGQQVLTVAALAGLWSALGALVGAASDDWESVPAGAQHSP